MATLRNLSRRCQGEVLRALTFALKHNATITIRCAAARKVSADSWHRRNETRLQRRGDRERRARGAGHTDGCNWPFCRNATAIGRKERIPGRHGTILRRLQASPRKSVTWVCAAKQWRP